MRALVVILAIGVSTPALAQHQGHDMAKPKTGPEMDSPRSANRILQDACKSHAKWFNANGS